MNKQKGVASTMIIIVMLVMVAVIPITTKLVQQNQENRSKAATTDSLTSGICGTDVNTCISGRFGDRIDSETQQKWGCFGEDGSPSEECSLEISTGTIINGICFDDLYNRCFAGTLVDVDNVANNLKWDCVGINGGTTANCSWSLPFTDLVNGICGTSNKNNYCIDGFLADIADTATHYKWNCDGYNGGTTAKCSLDKSIPTPMPCTSYVYSGWSDCLDGSQKRTKIGLPSGCLYDTETLFASSGCTSNADVCTGTTGNITKCSSKKTFVNTCVNGKTISHTPCYYGCDVNTNSCKAATPTPTISIPIPTPTISRPIPTPTIVSPSTCARCSTRRGSSGDANCDNIINELDFSAWLSEYQKGTKSKADFNCSGSVGIEDFSIWNTNFKP